MHKRVCLVLPVLYIIVADRFGGLLHLGVERSEAVACGNSDYVGVVVAVTSRISRIAGVSGIHLVDTYGMSERILDTQRDVEASLLQERFLKLESVINIVGKGSLVDIVEGRGRLIEAYVGCAGDIQWQLLTHA